MRGTVVLLSAFLLLLFSSRTASANFAIHGNFLADTDACAGCHRSHTATSPITWKDPWTPDPPRSALLLSKASTVQQFCYTCHGTGAPGASTDVEDGIYTSSSTLPTESVVGAVLNGGGFAGVGYGKAVTSTHIIDSSIGTAWGGGTTGPGTSMTLDCSSCHAVHGSSNYRLLGDVVNGHVVGGYGGNPRTDIDPPPTPHVLSNEVGFPLEGFRLHTAYDGVSRSPGGRVYPRYLPNYTTARYARPFDSNGDGSADSDTGISGWCTACHEQYSSPSSPYDAGDGGGTVMRFRHPVNIPLSNWYEGEDPTRPIGDRALIIDQTAWQRSFVNPPPFVDIPVEHDPSVESGPLAEGAQVSDESDYIGCLTCHRAHGTSARMSGYANASDPFKPRPDNNPNGRGVPPSNDSSLLRADNRGVCERCHNK